jgi:hypothetical protein
MTVPTDPGLAVARLVADSLMLTLGVRFGYHAHRNVRRTDVGGETVLWRRLRRVGVAGALFGAFGLVEVASGVPLPVRDAVWLAFLLALVLVVADIERRTTDRAEAAWPRQGFGGAILVAAVAAFIAPGATLTGYEALVALALAAYGLGIGRRYLVTTTLEGTALDSILRHLLPLPALGGLALAVDAATFVVADPTVVGHVRVILVVMTATGLMSASIKLRQQLGRVR